MAITKEQLLQNLREGERELLQKLEGIPRERFEEGCYESGWNGRQVLAHITAIEWTYPKLIDLAMGVTPPPKSEAAKTDAAPGSPPHRPASGGIDSYNARSIARYDGFSVDDLIAEFKKNRATTIAKIEATAGDVFHKQVRSAGGIQGELGDVMNTVAYHHVRSHVDDIARAAVG